MELDVLKIWPDWKVVKTLGEGSFGKVYEIVRSNFGIEEHCALKVISIPSSEAELQSMRNEGMDQESVTEYYKGLVEEFVQEIALMSKLKGNINIVGYEDYAVIEHKDSVGWDILIRMELLTALPAYIREKSFSADDVLNMAVDVCNALEACHEHKIIHRDIKPDNIFISSKGGYKLGDFGVARTMEKTVSGLSKKGTYTYMAPEVYKGEIYGSNVDLYSLGIAMYKLLNDNREPFLPPYPEKVTYSDKNNALVRRLGGEVLPPPANSNQYLNQIIFKACAFNSSDRYKSPTNMKTDLNTVKKLMAQENKPVLTASQMTGMANSTLGQSQKSDPLPQQTSEPSSQSLKKETNMGQKVYMFSANNGAPVEQDTKHIPSQVVSDTSKKKSGNKSRSVGLVLSWISVVWCAVLLGTMVTSILEEELELNVLVCGIASIIVFLLIILLSRVKTVKTMKILGFLMLLASICSINILGVVASIVFLCIKESKKKN